MHVPKSKLAYLPIHKDAKFVVLSDCELVLYVLEIDLMVFIMGDGEYLMEDEARVENVISIEGTVTSCDSNGKSI